MSDEETTEDSAENRREERGEPYEYLPHVVVNPSGDPEVRITGFVRNESRNGFSAQFNVDFPYEPGDVLDVRVGYQRAWAQVVWVKPLMEDLCVAGFRLHPPEFLENVQEESTQE